jgi:tryptophan synthase alpha subunit
MHLFKTACFSKEVELTKVKYTHREIPLNIGFGINKEIQVWKVGKVYSGILAEGGVESMR